MVARRSVLISARAEKKIASARAWWLKHRDKAPAAFDEDLEQALTFIAENALVALVVVKTKKREIRRVLMPRAKLYLYYHATPRGRTAMVLAASPAVGEKLPRF